jgi:dTDP-4-amino-4,6-dideoxygalactose transaminase
VEMFEEAMAEYSGAAFGVATESCSMALLLSLLYEDVQGTKIALPAKTYISVPAAVQHAGAIPVLTDHEWSGAYYLGQTGIVDSALRMTEGMYQSGTLYCVSFHARKHLKIGRGGMILTDDLEAADWLRRARFDGRTGSVPFLEDDVETLGWNGYLTPEQAARGLQLLEHLPAENADLTPDYPDLRNLPVFSVNRGLDSLSGRV